MPWKKVRTFYQAAFQFAAEFVGTHAHVTIEGSPFSSVTAVALREKSEAWTWPVTHYQLTCFAAGGDWSQLLFDARGNVVSEVFGGPDTKPAVAQSHELF